MQSTRDIRVGGCNQAKLTTVHLFTDRTGIGGMTNYSFRQPRDVVLLAVLIISGLNWVSFQPHSAQTPVTCYSASGIDRFGVNEVLGWPGLYPPDRLERSLSLMAEAGIRWVRVNWAWKDMEPQNGPFDYSHLDAVAQIAAKHQIQLLPILLAVPAWSSTAPAQLKAQYGNLSPVDRYRPQDSADWLHYVQNVIKRYDGVNNAAGLPRMNYWEVWNEENLPDFWPPAPNPAEYLALLKATYQTIKAIDPTATVVLGGLANAGFSADGSNYLQSLYNLGGGAYFDVVSIHVYSNPNNGIAPVVQDVTGVRAIMDAHGDQDKPLWLTEIGWSDAPNAWDAPTVSQADIASFLNEVYTASMPADAIFWYNFRNIFANSPDVEHNFGLVNADFSPKPAFNAYKALAGQCPSNGAASNGSAPFF